MFSSKMAPGMQIVASLVAYFLVTSRAQDLITTKTFTLQLNSTGGRVCAASDPSVVIPMNSRATGGSVVMKCGSHCTSSSSCKLYQFKSDLTQCELYNYWPLNVTVIGKCSAYGTPPSPKDGVMCPVGWNGPYNGNCYYISSNTMTANQSNARSACLCLGAELTSVVNEDECNYISNISFRLALSQASYWIGLLKTSPYPATFSTYFLDLSLTTYRPPWATAEPNEASVCTRLVWDKAVTPHYAGLKDGLCDRSFSYICKMAVGYKRTVVSHLGLGVPPVISINSWIVIQNKCPSGNSSISFSNQHAVSSACGVRSISFSTQGWIDYRNGFGDLMTTITNYWMGNKHINSLTKSAQYKLRVEVRYSNGIWYSAEYGSFNIEAEANNFSLAVSGFSGDADDALQFPHSTTSNTAANGQMFSTSDRDNDMVGINCAQDQGGGWWYGSTCSIPTVNVDGMAYWYDGRSTQATAPNIIASMMKIQLA